jgi:hypothetical protein
MTGMSLVFDRGGAVCSSALTNSELTVDGGISHWFVAINVCIRQPVLGYMETET